MSEGQPPAEDDIEQSKAPLLDHLIELRQRLFRSFLALAFACVLGYWLAQPVYDFLVAPLRALFADRENFPLIYLNLYEAFVTKLKLTLALGFVIAFPIIGHQLWRFVAPGLYRHERRAALPFLIASPVLFLLGGALVYYLVMPLAWRFLLSVGEEFGGDLQQTMAGYLSLVIHMILAFGISFQLPIVLMLLARAGMVRAATLAKGRRYAIVGVFAFAAVVTPPDILSQLILGIPLVLLYELSVLGVRLIERRRTREEAAASR
ncbi:MAG: twin-arginine translocase subunit TatC [Alphaproteobacteria bacterium]|nr:MAG: twin-arginine translocase subunit TatC [Alphaproteobacteria bacterium]